MTARESVHESNTAPSTASDSPARARLLAHLPVRERRLNLAGIPTAVLEAGDGPPCVLLHGPGASALHWMLVLPFLLETQRVVIPDLPGHGASGAPDGPIADHILSWLDDLIRQTCAAPPVLVGALLGGAIGARYAIRHPGRLERLILVDSFGLQRFQPSPEFAAALTAFHADPDARTHDALWNHCAYDLAGVRDRLGPLWAPFTEHNVENARASSGARVRQELMSEAGAPEIASEELERITRPTALIWGRYDRATPLSVAEAASTRYGWPLRVIDHANDDPVLEQPEAFMLALEATAHDRANTRTRAATISSLQLAERDRVHTLVIGGGQAGLATSYWLTQAGVDHVVVERRRELGGSWHDRWDSFQLIAPNFTLRLPGMHYAGPDPEAFLSRDEIIDYVRRYAQSFESRVRLGVEVARLEAADGGFHARAGAATFIADNVVLATGAYPKAKTPAFAASLPAHIRQLHSNDYRRPDELPQGAVLVVGSGLSGAQIADALLAAGRTVHLAVSMCPNAPRRYRGRDLTWWLLQAYLHGDKVGVHFPTVADLPNPAARFACNPVLPGPNGGRDISPSELARRGARLYGRLEALDGTRARFSTDLAERLAFADRAFDEEFKPLFDAYIDAAGVDAPPDDRARRAPFSAEVRDTLDLDAAQISTVIWATGYRLDFDWVRFPIFDAWGYPKHVRGVTDQPGLYVVGLPWLHSEPSSVIAGVGADAAHVARMIVRRGFSHAAESPGAHESHDLATPGSLSLCAAVKL